MKKLNSCILIESSRKNKYFHDRKKKRTTLCHPLLYFLLTLAEEGTDVGEWLTGLGDGPVTIDGYGSCSKKDLEYYYNKYLILKAAGHFDTIDQEKKMGARYTPAAIKNSLANTRLVTFEVTDRCNLQCEYCGYGKFYNDYDQRDNKNIDFDYAARLLEYLQNLWNSPLNHSHDKEIYIGFYGGEPLMNFSFIKELVAFSKTLHLSHNRLCFSMTTNGLLLEKHMDFLVENDFNLLISLDGDEENNGYRVFKNQRAAYKDIIGNVRALRAKYPDYFDLRVNFNAVLHNKNSVSDIFSFFKREFGKIPRIGALSTSGISNAQQETFWKTYANINESLYNSEDYSMIEKEMFIMLPNIQDVGLFLLKGSDFSFDNYSQMLRTPKDSPRYPTGTCVPFGRKIFVTVNGKILPCERIGHEFTLGRVDGQSVSIDYRSIAEKYNAWHDKMRKQCSVCHNADRCPQCVFSLNLQQNKPQCTGFLNQKDYSRRLGAYVDFLENRPGLYTDIFQKVLVG